MRAQPAIDRLVSVPIREVWADEARDLTPWLAANLEDLSSAIGMDLELKLVFDSSKIKRVGSQ